MLLGSKEARMYLFWSFAGSVSARVFHVFVIKITIFFPPFLWGTLGQKKKGRSDEINSFVGYLQWKGIHFYRMPRCGKLCVSPKFLLTSSLWQAHVTANPNPHTALRPFWHCFLGSTTFYFWLRQTFRRSDQQARWQDMLSASPTICKTKKKK